VVTVAAVAAWGAAFTAIPVALQSAVLRVAPQSADTASALYVVTFQVGIGGGALAGSVLVNSGLLSQLPLTGTLLAAAGAALLLAARRAFPSRPGKAGQPPLQVPDPAGSGPAGSGPAGPEPARPEPAGGGPAGREPARPEAGRPVRDVPAGR
jgi:hypothetical protein